MTRGELYEEFVLAFHIILAITVIVAGMGWISRVGQRRSCQTLGYVSVVKVGTEYVCVGVGPEGDYVAEPLEAVRERLGEN